MRYDALTPGFDAIGPQHQMRNMFLARFSIKSKHHLFSRVAHLRGCVPTRGIYIARVSQHASLPYLPKVKFEMVSTNYVFQLQGEFSLITISQSRECVDRSPRGSPRDERWRPGPTKPTLNPTITSPYDSSSPADTTSRTIAIEPAGDSLMVKAQVKGYSMQSDAQKWSNPPPGAAVCLVSAVHPVFTQLPSRWHVVNPYLRCRLSISKAPPIS